MIKKLACGVCLKGRKLNFLYIRQLHGLMCLMLFHDLLVNLSKPIKDNVYYFLEQTTILRILVIPYGSCLHYD